MPVELMKDNQILNVPCPKCGACPIFTKPPYLRCSICKTEFKLVVT